MFYRSRLFAVSRLNLSLRVLLAGAVSLLNMAVYAEPQPTLESYWDGDSIIGEEPAAELDSDNFIDDSTLGITPLDTQAEDINKLEPLKKPKIDIYTDDSIKKEIDIPLVELPDEDEKESQPAIEDDTVTAEEIPAVPDIKTEAKTSQPEEIVVEEKGYLARFLSALTIPGFTFSGYLKNETAYRFREPRSMTKIKNILYLESQYAPSDTVQFNMAGWAYYDHAYDLFDYQTISARLEREDKEPLVFIEDLQENKDSSVAALRELYVDLFLDDFDIRLGKQYVVWGVLEGNRVTDEINPIDFRELTLPALLDYRIPLWTAKVDYYRDEATYQFLWIPELKFHKPAPGGSEWELLQSVEGTYFPESYKLANSEFGFRVTTDRFFDAEVALSYFYTWDDYPVMFRHMKVRLDAEPDFFPTYTRMSLWGATILKPMGRAILKGEIAYSPDKYFGIQNTTDGDVDGFLDQNGVFKKAHIRWGLGVDFNYKGMEISPAIVQWIIFAYDEPIIQDEFETTVSLYLRKPFAKGSRLFEMLAIYSPNYKESYMKPKVTFLISDNFHFTAGFDLFQGAKSQFGVGVGGVAQTGYLVTLDQRARFFGNFNENDRFFVEFKYSF